MNSLARQFFARNSFTAVHILSEIEDADWEEVSRLAFNLPKGWFELSRLDPKDRIEFVRDFWLERLPYHPSAHPAFFEFFEQLDDVAVVLTQTMQDEPFDSELVYSLADGSSFFRGRPPSAEGDLLALQQALEFHLPSDYAAFTSIHNGFGKLSEMGLLEIEEILNAKRRVAHLIEQGGLEIDPDSLIPFFEALGLASFQCFFADWYPGNEMGNVYLSGIDYTLSDVGNKKMWVENLAFPTFSEWLAYYLQGMNLCI
jgi:hypothetical protein